MNHRDTAALMAGLAPVIRDYVVAAYGERLAALETRPAPERGEKGEPGAAVDPELIERLVAAAVEKRMAALPKPVDGKSVEPADVRLMLAEEVAKIPPAADGKSVTIDDVRPVLQEMIGALPKPVDGKSIDPADVRLMVAEEVAKIPPAADGKSVTVDDVRPVIEEMVAALPKPVDGKSVEPADVRLMVAEEVAKIPSAVDGKSVTVDDVRPVLMEMVAALPKPVDGKSVEPADVRLMVSEEVAKIPPPSDGKSVTVEEVIAALPKPVDGKDGVGLAGAMIDREGELVVTLTDGTHRKLGAVVGKDGTPGERGKDGFGFEEFEELVEDGGRVFVRRYSRGDDVKEFRHVTATPIYRGVWKEAEFKQGDEVTFGGSQFIALCDTKAKPEASHDWQLACKRGRDGRDGKPGEKGAPGSEGKPGLNGREF